MRFKHYIRRSLEGGSETILFGPVHFADAGVGYSSVGGMPILEAYQLVNKWNLQQHEPQFIYCLE